MSQSKWHQPWPRIVTMIVVCACAIWGAIHMTPKVSGTKVVQLKQGDGKMIEKQCRDIEIGTSREDIRKKFGYPTSEGNDDTYWHYPLRDKDDNIFCNLYFGYCSSCWNGGENKVIGTWLDLRKN